MLFQTYNPDFHADLFFTLYQQKKNLKNSVVTLVVSYPSPWNRKCRETVQRLSKLGNIPLLENVV